ncbi:Pyruvate formate-lyase activating enzyme [Anaerovibrio sp. JC8]|uniref:glycyl-radical enzyme activating protein n=1 Tax=Anaerovibrio sp. JC8 TaxID=1240085 RepID=UPI000A0E7754|nr:glycyl-radical enzyme activating protein [Anaerovibrio sp. JC8]ORT99125.1 Pyruvate formate-lyase activating enzyme [Anaerovibrio sp. JC8]
MEEGIITNIQHFSTEDGPGIRTVVFFKGCPFRCKWCANPETQQFQPELGWSAGACLKCGSCVKQLKKYNISIKNEEISWDSGSSSRKLPSYKDLELACPTKALHLIGKKYTVDELIKILLEQKPFFDETGGLTISGGEPLAQPHFALSLLEQAQANGIKTAIETTSYAAWDTVANIARHIDYYMTDIKVMDSDVHKEWTGLPNQKILSNIKRLIQEFPHIHFRIRTPVIPGVNDNPTAIKAIADYLKPFEKRRKLEWELLKYHRLGLPKYASLHRPYPMGEVELPQDKFEELHRLADSLFKSII